MHTENKNTLYYQSRDKLRNKLFEAKIMLPSRYVFILTNKCNLNCSFCFQDRKGREGSLTIDQWLNFSEQLPSYAHITLTGGEPLVFKNFDKLFREIDNRFSTNIISNGVLLSDKFIDLFAKSKNLKVLSISIDDIGNHNRDLSPAQWENIENYVKYFKKHLNDLGKKDLIIDSKTVVLDSNSAELFEIYKYLKEKLNIDSHSFQFLKGSPIQHADFSFEYNKIFEKSIAHEYADFDRILIELEKVRKYNLENKFYSYTHPNFVDLNSEKPIYEQNYKNYNLKDHKKNEFEVCKAPWESMHINVEGSVYPCLAVEMGNIKENTLKEIFFGSKYEKFKNDLLKNHTFEACNRCGYLKMK
jgi:MoaA/NifB/PqqE/SkfB family radical SAM enzyme